VTQFHADAAKDHAAGVAVVPTIGGPRDQLQTQPLFVFDWGDTLSPSASIRRTIEEFKTDSVSTSFFNTQDADLAELLRRAILLSEGSGTPAAGLVPLAIVTNTNIENLINILKAYYPTTTKLFDEMGYVVYHKEEKCNYGQRQDLSSFHERTCAKKPAIFSLTTTTHGLKGYIFTRGKKARRNSTCLVCVMRCGGQSKEAGGGLRFISFPSATNQLMTLPQNKLLSTYSGNV